MNSTLKNAGARHAIGRWEVSYGMLIYFFHISKAQSREMNFYLQCSIIQTKHLVFKMQDAEEICLVLFLKKIPGKFWTTTRWNSFFHICRNFPSAFFWHFFFKKITTPSQTPFTSLLEKFSPWKNQSHGSKSCQVAVWNPSKFPPDSIDDFDYPR